MLHFQVTDMPYVTSISALRQQIASGSQSQLVHSSLRCTKHLVVYNILLIADASDRANSQPVYLRQENVEGLQQCRVVCAVSEARGELVRTVREQKPCHGLNRSPAKATIDRAPSRCTTAAHTGDVLRANALRWGIRYWWAASSLTDRPRAYLTAVQTWANPPPARSGAI